MTDTIVLCGQERGAGSETPAALAVRLREVERGVDEGIFAGVRAAVHLVPLAIALVLLSSRLALAALACLVPFALALRWLRARFRVSHARATRLAEELHAGVDELVRHLDLWRSYGAGNRVQQALERTGQEAAQAAARADTGRVLLSGGNEVLAAGALMGAIALVEQGLLPLGQGSLIAFAAVFFLMYRPLRDLGDARAATERGAQALGELERIRLALLAGSTAPNVHGRASTSCTLAWKPARLEVEELAVFYGDQSTPATSLHAEPGEIVALVGPTGSGKTSLLRALLGLERRVRGSVRYGELDLGAAGVGPSERPFAWVPQEPAIVTGTLEENIALGAPPGTTGELIDARSTLEQLGARSLLERDPEVRLHAGGAELSGGERQWVAIARALSSGLPVLLLDEPTAGLDALSQERVLETLSALRGQRTVILVTHRPEPLSIADRVVSLGKASLAKTQVETSPPRFASA